MKVNTELFRALGDETRLRIMKCLCVCGSQTCRDICVCELGDCLNVKSSTLSSHLIILRRAGLVMIRKDATWVYYRPADGLPAFIREAIRAFAPPESDPKRLKSRLSLRAEGRCCVSLGALK